MKIPIAKKRERERKKKFRFPTSLCDCDWRERKSKRCSEEEEEEGNDEEEEEEEEGEEEEEEEEEEQYIGSFLFLPSLYLFPKKKKGSRKRDGWKKALVVTQLAPLPPSLSLFFPELGLAAPPGNLEVRAQERERSRNTFFF